MSERKEHDRVATFQLTVGAATDVGKVRSANEDRYAVWKPTPEEDPDIGAMLVVADGMGGERGGAHASQLTIDRLLEWFSSGAYRAWPEYQDRCDLADVLRRSARDISDELFLVGEKDASLQGLGSTLVQAIVCDRRITICHVGDSRCYRFRDDTLRRLTVDHTWVEDQVVAGVLTPEQAQRHPQRNVLTRSLGDAETPEADIRTEPLVDRDLFILCSDGLTGKVTDEMIAAAAAEQPVPQELANHLVQLANELDGSDNVTVVVCRCVDQLSTGDLAEPDDTQPMDRPDLSDLSDESAKPPTEPAERDRWSFVLLALSTIIVTLLLSWWGLRVVAGQRYDRAVAAIEEGNYLVARQELKSVLGLTLDDAACERLLDLIFHTGEEAGTLTAEEGTAEEPPADEPAAGEPAVEEP